MTGPAPGEPAALARSGRGSAGGTTGMRDSARAIGTLLASRARSSGHHRIPAPGVRSERRSQRVRATGRTTSRSTARCGLLRPRRSSPTTPLATSTRSGAWASSATPWASSGSRSRPVERHRPAQAAVDPGRPRRRLPDLRDGPRSRGVEAPGADRRGDLPLQPDHLVRQHRLGPGRFVRRRSSCCSACASCGATGRNAPRSTRPSRRSSSRSSASSSRSSRPS